MCQSLPRWEERRHWGQSQMDIESRKPERGGPLSRVHSLGINENEFMTYLEYI